MNRFAQIFIFIILLGTMFVTACALPCDLTDQTVLDGYLAKVQDLANYF